MKGRSQAAESRPVPESNWNVSLMTLWVAKAGEKTTVDVGLAFDILDAKALEANLSFSQGLELVRRDKEHLS